MDSNSVRDAREVLDRPGDMAQDRPNRFYEGIGYAPSLLPPTTLAQSSSFLHSCRRGNLPTSASTSEFDPVWITEVREAVKGLSVGPAAYAPYPVATDVIIGMSNSTAGRRQNKQRW